MIRIKIFYLIQIKILYKVIKNPQIKIKWNRLIKEWPEEIYKKIKYQMKRNIWKMKMKKIH